MIEVTLEIGKLFDLLSEYEDLDFTPEQEQFFKTPVYIQNEHSEWIIANAGITKSCIGRMIFFDNGDTIKAADKHLIFNGSQCVHVDTLKNGSCIVKANGDTIKVVDIQPIDDHLYYDLSVDSPTHLYQTSNGIVHHNTELAKLLAESLNYSFFRLDMSEFQEKHSLSRLIGSPPGYVGYSDGAAGSGALINALEQSPQCVLLIDEVEKAHPDVSQLFLQVMDAGVLTSANQKTVHMHNVILIFTSNLGAQELDKSPLGFVSGTQIQLADTESAPAVKKFFAPEFRNRLDAVVNFKVLTDTNMHLILDKFMANLNNMCATKKVTVTLDPQAKDWLIRNGFDPVMGARPLQRCVDEHIKKPMAREILFGKLKHGGSVLVTVDTDLKLKLDFLSMCVPAVIMDTELHDLNWETSHGVD
jgi:hypothetical protein